MRNLMIGAATAALVLSATAASAVTIQDVTIQSVSGEWTDTTPGNVFGLTGEGTEELRWGLPSTLVKTGLKSGYRFDGAIPPETEEAADTPFALGTFTHFNNRIMAVGNGMASTISSVDLAVEISLMIGAVNYMFTQVFTFLHDETPNSASTCAYGGTPGNGVNGSYGCNDRVTAALNESASDELVVDGLKYTFEFSGFQYNDGVFDYFDTVEEETNKATLLGLYRVEKVGEQISPVPLPAAGWLLLAGVGGLAALKRRQKRGPSA